MPKKIDLTGHRFGKLIVIGEAPSKNGRAMWRCVCDCGNEKVVGRQNLMDGMTKSCGCLRIKFPTLHGMAKSRICVEWRSMKQRCYNQKAENYYLYGGRGITVCDEWKDFEKFYAWAMDNGYTDELTLDRIDSNGNYCPENCRWATVKQQANNRRSNRWIEYNGERRTLQEWSEITGIERRTISRRIGIGWSAEDALTVPVSSSNRYKTIKKEKEARSEI